MDENQYLNEEITCVNDEKPSLPYCEKISKLVSVDRGLIPVKLSYFFTYAAIGSFIPFLAVFLTSIGLSATQAGFIIGSRTVVSFVCGSLWGVLSDKTGRRKLIHLTICIGLILLVFPLPWIAKTVSKSYEKELVNGNHKNYSTGIDVAKNFNFNNNISNELLGDSFIKIENIHNESNVDVRNDTKSQVVLNEKQIFFTMLAAFSLSAAFDSPLIGYHDSVAIKIMNDRDHKANYGMQRVFGSIGFALANFFAGFVADRYTDSSMSPYTAVFYVFLLFAIVTLFIAVYLHRGKKNCNIKAQPNHKDTKMLKLIIKTFSTAHNIMFLISVTITGIAHALNYGFLFLFMEDDLKASKSMMGLSIVIGCTSEILIFPISGKIIKKLNGPFFCMILGLFSYAIRYFSYSYIHEAWIILPIQILHSIGFGLFWAAAVEQTQKISSQKIMSTMLMLVNGFHFPLGTFLGNMLGGYLYQYYGGRQFFCGSAILFAGWCLVMLIYHYSYKRCLNEKTDEVAVDDEENFDEIQIFEDQKN